MLTLIILTMLLGVIAGLLAGLFGLGGGVVIVPALVWVFSAYAFPSEQIMIMAIATSLAAIIPTSISSMISHHKLGAIQWDRVLRLVPGIVLGAGLGAVIADLVDAEVLKRFFICYLFYTGIHMALPSRLVKHEVKTNKGMDYLVGNGIGFLSSLLGIGGGTLTVPYLLGRQVAMKNAVAISGACGLPIALSGTVMYALLGRGDMLLPEWSMGYVYLPALCGIVSCSIFVAPLGAKLAHILPAKKLKRYFSVVIFLIVFKMLVS
ncbi:MAG: sulfite exporter TauE/SafE family protein [Methylococcales bacterium]|nr:sulfite exporter TauE/SafE family protein [Methylococcales bacterium]